MSRRPNPAAESESALVAGAEPGRLRARLVAAQAPGSDPFVVLHEGRFARILLAELVDRDDNVRSRFAWKLRADVVGAPVCGAGPCAAPSNGESDRSWQRERAELLRVRSPHVVAAAVVPPSLLVSRPVFHCRHRDVWFHPVCPDSGRPLRVCRDDAALAAAGLPRYEHDTVRYLYGGAAVAGAAPRPAKLYHAIGVDPATLPAAGGAHIADGAQLVRDWAALVLDPDASSELPCHGCSERAHCFAGGDDAASLPALDRLVAFSFYDVDSVALELADEDFDRAIDRLGGGTGIGSGERAWLLGGDVRARALEALRLKVGAFADVCRGVYALHRVGRPHLAVASGNVVAFDGGVSRGLPRSWRTRFALTDLGGAAAVQAPGTDATLWQPGREVAEDPVGRLFLAPMLRSLEGGSVTISVELQRDADRGGAVRLHVPRAGVPSFVLPGDLVVVADDEHGAGCHARVEQVTSRGLEAVVHGAADDIAIGSRAARLTFVRNSGPSADLYGLGMLLLRILLVHDEQPLEAIAATVERCLQLFSSAGAAGERTLVEFWQDLLDGDAGGGRFAVWHLLADRQDREALRAAVARGEQPVPDRLWHRLLAIAGRLLLASPVARRDDAEVGDSPVEGVLAEVAALERELHVELFEAAARDDLLVTVCRERLQRIGEQAGARPPLAAAATRQRGQGPGFVLAVARVGDPEIRQYHFDQDRVTIGRRDDDNVLQLADAMVSSRHAVIEWLDGEYALSDRGSTNGTEVDGIRLPIDVPQPLGDGSTIQIRPFVLSFRRSVADADARHPTAASMPLAPQLRARLAAVYADASANGTAAVRRAMHGVLDELEHAVAADSFAAALATMVRRGDGNAESIGDAAGAGDVP